MPTVLGVSVAPARSASTVLLVVAGLIAFAPTEQAAQHPVHSRVIDLCTLVAVPGNAFSYIPAPTPPPAGALRARSTAATISVTYVGFDAFPQAQAAFQSAVDIWASLISTPVPISVRAQFTPLAPNVLGSAGAQYVWRDFPGAPVAGTYYADALADKLRGSDAYPGQFDILASFNSSFSSWYFGTDGNTPGGSYDFVSVVLHELGHGLGFLGGANVASGSGSIGLGGYPLAYDRFVVTETGVPLLNFLNPSNELGTQLTSGYAPGDPRGPGVYWSGSNAVSANAGLTPRLYTPSTWSPGSSYSHLDENTYVAGNPNSLMTPALSGAEAIHNPGPITLGMFTDLGWTPVPVVVSGPAGRDFNADGQADLLFESTSGQLYAWYMTGATLTGGGWLTPNQIDPQLRVVGTSDFTGDGKVDLVLQDQQTGAVTIYKMDGLTKIAEQSLPIAANTLWKVVATGDFNGDQFADIAWENFSTGQIYIWFMKPLGGNAGYAGANGAFLGDYVRAADQSVITLGATTARVAGAADLDQDTHLDLVWQDDTAGAVSVWYLNGTILTSMANVAMVNPVWRLRSVGDYNGDTKPDLIWQHSTGGDLYAWYLNGGALVSGGYLSPSAVNPAWQLVGPR
ncbi:MAG: FG-GAP-like repeat-containing protein [Acidobacteriota bacterium]